MRLKLATWTLVKNAGIRLVRPGNCHRDTRLQHDEQQLVEAAGARSQEIVEGAAKNLNSLKES